MYQALLLLGGILGGCLLPLAAAAQLKSLPQQFMSSTVVLNDGDTLRGSVVLHNDLDLLLITMPDGTVRSVPALAVRTFAVRDEIRPFDRLPPMYRGTDMLMSSRPRRRQLLVQRARPFLVYPWNHDRDYGSNLAPAFFERLNGGPVILLRRQQLVTRNVSLTDPGLMGSYMPRFSNSGYFYTDVREQLYLATPQGSIVPLRRPKRDLLAYFPAEAEQIEEYAHLNHLSYVDGAQLARLVDYANSLRELTASAR